MEEQKLEHEQDLEYQDIPEEESDEEYQEKLAEKLQVFGSRLARQVTSEVGKRADIEERWLKDLRQYHGKYEPDEQTKLAASEGSEVFVNITRNKTNAAEARLSDMLFPTDDKNWGIKPTPIPTLSKQARQTENPEEAQAASYELGLAKERSEAMAREIDDQLTESNYAAKGRDAIHDACVLGAGILKGPVVVGRIQKIWQTDEHGNSILELNESLSPGTQVVDPWNFYPEHGAARIEEAEYTYERHYLTKKQLISLSKVDGYLKDQLRMVLGEDSRNSQATHNWQSEIRAISGITDSGDQNRYEMWEYNGPIDKDDLLSAGAEIEDDDLIEYYGTVLFIGNHVVRVSLHPMDTEDDLYRVFCWEKDTSSIFGFGVPYLMRNPQKVMNGSFRMVLDNGGLSAGPQIVIDKDAVDPADGEWTIKPRKIWHKKKSGVQVDHAFKVYQITNNQTDLMGIFNAARQLADEETNLPLIAQGEQSSNVTKTVRGMDMLMNSANIVLRRAVKNWDDDVTRPHITAYYNWNMQFNENPEIKGDFTIDARGSGALLAREMQNERLLQLSGVAGSNPEFAKRTDWGGLYSQIVKHMQIAVDDVLLPQEQLDQINNAEEEPPVDPMIQLKQQELEMKQQQFFAELDVRKELELTSIASREDLTIAQLQEKTALEQYKEQNKRDIEAGRQTLAQSQQLMQKQNLSQGYDTF